jgi:lysyl-tRNA synthetase class 2
MRQKLVRLRGLGAEPFALRFKRARPVQQIKRKFEHLIPGQEDSSRIRVAGRIRQIRPHGRLAFATLQDSSEAIQLVFEDSFLLSRTPRSIRRPTKEITELFDIGDIVGADGSPIRTRKGELSVKVHKLTLLTKALRPLPEKWHGLRDPEAKQRRRYLDLASSLESRRVVSVRAKVLKAFRRVLEERGFVEVETPVLQVTAGGALARPFTTHHLVLDIPLYLRVAPELYLKRLLVGGLERVYEIGRNFRNEGIDRDHNPEFTMLEAYQAYGDYEDMMDLAETLIREAALAVRGSLRFEYRGRPLDLEPSWRRASLLDLLSEALGEAVELDQRSLESAAARHGLEVDPAWGPGKIALELYEKRVERTVWDPTFVIDFPREVSPLARAHRSKPGLTEQFDLVIAGMEMGPAYSELTDPDEQRDRFLAQQDLRRRGDEEAHPLDEDFLEALEHGMPPAGGIGIGVDRVTMILADEPSIRDVILFPHLRPETGKA